MLNKNQQKIYFSPEHKQFLILKISIFSLFIILFLSTLIGSYYIYKNVSDTLESAEVALLNNSLANIEIIDFEKLDKIEKKWNLKMNSAVIDLNKDLFAPLTNLAKK